VSSSIYKFINFITKFTIEQYIICVDMLWNTNNWNYILIFMSFCQVNLNFHHIPHTHIEQSGKSPNTPSSHLKNLSRVISFIVFTFWKTEKRTNFCAKNIHNGMCFCERGTSACLIKLTLFSHWQLLFQSVFSYPFDLLSPQSLFRYLFR